VTITSDVAVVGAGILGLATAEALRTRGASVHVYERGVPGAGQSGGESRIFRHGHDDPRLVELARVSRRLYREWGDQLGVELVSDDGAVMIGPAAERRLPLMQRTGGIEVAEIDADELAERMPLLAPFAGPGIFDADGGSIRAAAAVDALAGRLGDRLVADEVLTLWPSAAAIEVRTGGDRGEHGAVVVCAGRDTPRLARGLGLSIPVEASLHGRVSFRVRAEAPSRAACLQDSSDAFAEPGTYGTPSPDRGAYSIGVGASTAAHEDASVIAPPDLAAVTDRAAAYVRRALPGLDPEPVAYRHCWVTTLPWHDDGIGVWEAGRALFLAGNNLFKHAPALGRALAEAALEGTLDPELRPAARLGAAPG
jgi:sarcosine oxidase